MNIDPNEIKLIISLIAETCRILESMKQLLIFSANDCIKWMNLFRAELLLGWQYLHMWYTAAIEAVRTEFLYYRWGFDVAQLLDIRNKTKWIKSTLVRIANKGENGLSPAPQLKANDVLNPLTINKFYCCKGTDTSDQLITRKSVIKYDEVYLEDEDFHKFRLFLITPPFNEKEPSAANMCAGLKGKLCFFSIKANNDIFFANIHRPYFWLKSKFFFFAWLITSKTILKWPLQGSV